MLFTSTASVAILSLLNMATAQPVAKPVTAEAIIIVEASHGGAGSGLTNTTINVPFNIAYINDPALLEVSTLYVTGATNGVPVESVTCTPYATQLGTGAGGLPFSYGHPSYLSTNTVVVGSIVCRSPYNQD